MKKKHARPVSTPTSPAQSDAPDPSIRWLLIVTIAIAILGIVPRIVGIFSDFWLDEIWTYYRLHAIKTPLEVFTKFRSDNNHYLNSLFMFMIGDTGHWYLYRLFSLAAGLLTIPLVWISARRDSFIQACMATMLTAGSYLLINFSSEARGYAPAILFSIATWYCLQRCRAESGLRWRIMLWIAICLGMLAHLIFLFVFIAAALWLPYDRLSKGRPWKQTATDWLQCFGVPVLFSAGFYLLVVRNIKVVGGPPYDLWAILAETVAYAGGEGQFVNPASVVWGILTVGLMAWAIVLLWKRGRSEWLFFSVVVFLAPIAALLIHRPEVLFVRYFLIDIFFGYIALSYLFADLARNRKAQAGIAVAVFLAIFLAGNGFQAARLMEFGRGGYHEAMRYIGEHSASDTITIVSDHPVRNGKLVDFYERFLPAGKQTLFFEGYTAAAPPEWMIVHAPFEPPVFPERGRDAYGFLFVRQKVFQYAGPSGWCWALYKSQPVGPGSGGQR